MKGIRIAAIATSFLSAVLSLSAFAQSYGNSVTFTAAAAHEIFSSRRHMDNVTYPMVALGYNFTEHWGIEALLGIFHTNFDDTVTPTKQVSGTLFAVDGIYHFSSPSNVEPFITAGLGITGLSPNRFDATNEANFNFGLGVLVFANPAVALRLEARDFYTFVGGKNDLVFDAGVTFQFDWCSLTTARC